MIVDQAVYRGGRREACTDLSEALEALEALEQGEDGFLWIGLANPTPEELEHVNAELHLHPLAVEDILAAAQRPKVESYENGLLVILSALRYIDATSDIETGSIAVFVGARFVVTVRHGRVHPLTDVRRTLEGDPGRLGHGPSAVLHAVLDSVVDSYTDIDAALLEDLDEIERAVFSSEAVRGVTAIYHLKREVLEARRATLPLVDPLSALVGEASPLDEDMLPFFRDVLDHLLRVCDHIESYDRLLSDVLSAHLAQVSVQQNDDMRRISAWVGMAALPTMIAGIYGMNFEHMPELRQPWGYPAVLLLMATACLLLYRYFKRSGWL